MLIDIRLKAESGFDVARELATDGLKTALIMISTHPYVDFADMIADSPAVGFLPKRAYRPRPSVSSSRGADAAIQPLHAAGRAMPLKS